MLQKLFKIALTSAEMNASDFAKAAGTTRTTLYKALGNSDNSPMAKSLRSQAIDFTNRELKKLHIDLDAMKSGTYYIS